MDFASNRGLIDFFRNEMLRSKAEASILAAAPTKNVFPVSHICISEIPVDILIHAGALKETQVRFRNRWQ